MLRVLMAVAMLFSYFIIATSHAATIGDVACNDRDTLRLVMEQLVPVDEAGSSLVNCSLLPGEYVPEVVQSIGFFPAYCTSPVEDPYVCEAEVVQATYYGRLYYIAIGWMASLDADLAEDLLMAEEEPFLAVGIPCDFGPCELHHPHQRVGPSTFAGKTDRLKASVIAQVE